MGPCVRGIFRHIDGHIPEQQDVPFVAVFLQREPLFPEQVLAKDMKVNFLPQLFPVFPDGFRLAVDYFRIRPCRVHRTAEMLLHRGEKSKILHPGLFLPEPVRLGTELFSGLAETAPQQLVLILPYCLVVHFFRIRGSEEIFLTAVKQPFLPKHIAGD